MTSGRETIKRRYKLETVSRACSILRLFEDDRQTHSLTEVVERSGLERTICFRLLRTLVDEGLLRHSDRRKYATNVRILSGKHFRVGYASLAYDSYDSFVAAIDKGLRWAAASRP